jgi:phosphoglycerate dehydrogenase-like enzyme
VDALATGRLSGFAADVLPGEPDPREALALLSPFPNILVTPHTAAYDARTLRARYETSARIARALLDGDEGSVAEFRVK